MINLISDTTTKPTAAMLEAMMKAEVGDDVFGADPTVNALQNALAGMFGQEAGLFCPSGTMTNQIAIKTHTVPMDELICDHTSHVYRSENGGYAYNSGIAIKLIQGTNGKITPDQIEASINPSFDWLPKSKLVVIENSCNIGGGAMYTYNEMLEIKKVCEKNGLILHLDGARVFNVLVETHDDAIKVGTLFDSISICLSKGLGSPVGSVLLGSHEFIKSARRFRKAMGGGMRQAGYLAAAGLYALENNIDRLSIDNQRARELGECLMNQPYVESVRPVQTNIVIFDLKKDMPGDVFLEKLKEKDIHAVAFGPQTLRFVTHLDVNQEQVEKVKTILNQIR